MSKYGDKVKVKQKSFMIDDELYTAYYPMIEVDGKYVNMRDDGYKTSMINSTTRYKAKKLGETFLSKVKEIEGIGKLGGYTLEQLVEGINEDNKHDDLIPDIQGEELI